MATTDIYSVVGALQPTRPCLRFLGGDVDDGVQVDGLITGSATSIAQHNDTHGTITAWIMVPDDTGTYTIFGTGDANAVEYTEFKIAAGKLQFKVVDSGPSTRLDVITTSKVITPHKWTHVALVQDAVEPRFYVDGAMITRANMTFTTSTELTQWFDDLDGQDSGTIGASDSVAGGAALTNEFAGYISDVRVYSGTTTAAALTAAQILDDYRGNYTTLNSACTILAHYTFNRTVVNTYNAGTFDGTIVGALIYCDGNEFSSKLSFECGVPVTADNVVIGLNDRMGMGFVIQQA